MMTKPVYKRPRARSVPSESNGDFFSNKRKVQRIGRIKRVFWRDEQVAGASISDILPPSPQLTDPAILEVISSPVLQSVTDLRRHRYSIEQLLRLKDAPLSQKRPDFLDINEVPGQILVADKWQDRKKAETPPEQPQKSASEPAADPRRRPGDARERIRKENDGIVLGPQRRSFNSGCFVPVTRPTRAHSPLGKSGEPPHIGGPVVHLGGPTRRIGSGRILRDWDSGEKPSGPAANDVSDYPGGGGFRRQNSLVSDGGERERDRGRGNSFSSASVTSGYEKERESGGGGGGGRRGGGSGRYDRRRSESAREDEPEWFSSGPISQNDTIELRGFDDSDKVTASAVSGKMKRNAKRAKEWAKKKGDGQGMSTVTPLEETDEGQEEKVKEGKKTPVKHGHDDKHHQTKDSDKGPGVNNDQLSLFEDIFKADNISLLTNGGTENDAKQSRFASWFKQEQRDLLSPEKSIHDDTNNIVKGILRDIVDNGSTLGGGTNVCIPPPGDAGSYFAPISPADNSMRKGQAHNNNQKALNIMEMLQRGPSNIEDLAAPQRQMAGKILKLDEIESKLRQTSQPPPGLVPQSTKAQHQHLKQQHEEDLVAFKQLLAQVSGGQAVPASNGPPKPHQPMSLIEMLQLSQQQDEAARRAHIQQQQQQQQQTMLSKLMSVASQQQQQIRGTSPLMDLGPQQSRDLLQRPEAQAILHAMHQRIPSPRELQIHTQNILQKALIKKKLEEQSENYRKKQQEQAQQQQQRNQSPGGAKSMSSPTPLAFTPTSVLRKMTADKDDGKENRDKQPQGRALTGVRSQQPQQQQQGQMPQWAQQQFPPSKQPAGRPIVKANANYGQQGQNATDQFFTQQRLYNQLQQQQQQQRKMQPQQNNMNHMAQYGGQSAQFSSQQQHQLTQHQLRAQHQQRAPPANERQGHLNYQQQQQQQQNQVWRDFLNGTQHGNNRGGAPGRLNDGGGDLSPTTTNQLARWFSPDLLERARGGELPSTAALAQQALSLEEIERQQAPPAVRN